MTLSSGEGGADVTKAAYLECPECGKLCRPLRDHKDGGAGYRCINSAAHANSCSFPFYIDGNGDVDWR